VIPFATFDSEALDRLQAAVDDAWGSLPPDRRTMQLKVRMAEAVMRSASRGERDRARLAAIATATARCEPADVAV
jgi:hypothetical protein